MLENLRRSVPDVCDPNEAEPQARLATTLDLERIRDLNRRANGGDAEALAELRNLLEENPRIGKQVVDLQKHAELALIRLASGGDALAAESMYRTVAALKRELGGRRRVRSSGCWSTRSPPSTSS